jgi:hypothetical protein
MRIFMLQSIVNSVLKDLFGRRDAHIVFTTPSRITFFHYNFI